MSRDDARPRLAVHVRPRMGTLRALTLVGPRVAGERAARRAFETATALERSMSRFDPESDLNRIGAGSGRFVTVPAHLARALALARRLARATDGAFDPTVGPLTALWRRVGNDASPPPHALRAARRVVGWRRLQVRRRKVRLDRGMALDLDGFGKGWAADRIVSAVRREAPLAGLVNFGESSLAVIGRPPGDRGWPVLVRDLDGGLAGWFVLGRGGCATSAGDPVTGRRAGVVDPRSGRRLDRRAQVTVLAPAAAVAEAAATAMLVAGRGALDALARRLGVQACWIDAGGLKTTPGFRLRSLDIAPRA